MLRGPDLEVDAAAFPFAMCRSPNSSISSVMNEKEQW